MLYSNNYRLDPANNTELRILKMEEQRANISSLLANLSKYTYILEQLANLETKISDDLIKLYTNDSIYSDLVHNLNKVFLYKSDIVKRETKSLQNVIDKNKSVETIYKPLKPIFKHYFKSINKNEHYTKKLPKLIDNLEGKKRMKGELSKRDTEKMVRNKRKLENAQTDLKVVHDSIFNETNTINIEKFNPLNRIAKEFISMELSLTYLMADKLSILDNFETLLESKEDSQFNEKYFLDIKQEAKSRIAKSKTKKGNENDELSEIKPYKQNIQNNYYYLNYDGENNLSKNKDSNDIIEGQEGEYLNQNNYQNNKDQIIKGKTNIKAIEHGKNSRALALMK